MDTEFHTWRLFVISPAVVQDLRTLFTTRCPSNVNATHTEGKHQVRLTPFPPPNVQLESLAIFEVPKLVVVFLAMIDPCKQILLLAILQPSSPVYEVNELETPP